MVHVQWLALPLLAASSDNTASSDEQTMLQGLSAIRSHGLSDGQEKVPNAPCMQFDDWEALYDLGTPMADEQETPTLQQFGSTLQNLDINALTIDIRNVMFNNRLFWPADFGGVSDGVFSGEGGTNGERGNYGPLFVRLAWHCAGTYRMTDGQGGCAGGRQRFEPERSWEDNTNLDKARTLLAPIKIKYGDALSWGDLIIAAGTTALREMGTPVRQFCLGRVDETDGTNSLPLGIGGQPESSSPPCDVQGMCQEPLGAGTVGLIYVNPEGPVVEAGGSPVPNPILAAANIRDVFGRMGQDDRETVALIGGGHSIGKSHGACDIPHAGGLSPFEAFEQGQTFAWDGGCGQGSGLRGKGENVATSGIEGAWTTRPTYWDNEFFTKLVDREWELFTGPGGKYQWRIVNADAVEENLMRMTTDIALINDDIYRPIVEEFAKDQTAFDEAFDDAWFKLTHRGGMWSPQSKCDVGSVPAWVTEAGNNRMLDSDTGPLQSDPPDEATQATLRQRLQEELEFCEARGLRNPRAGRRCAANARQRFIASGGREEVSVRSSSLMEDSDAGSASRRSRRSRRTAIPRPIANENNLQEELARCEARGLRNPRAGRRCAANARQRLSLMEDSDAGSASRRSRRSRRTASTRQIANENNRRFFATFTTTGAPETTTTDAPDEAVQATLQQTLQEELVRCEARGLRNPRAGRRCAANARQRFIASGGREE